MQAEASLPLKMKELTYATLNNVLQLPNRSIRSGVSRGTVRRSIMGNCFKTTKMEVRSDQPIEKRTKPKVLCLHGWRTNGEILGMQMAALQSNTTMDCVFIDAPFPGRGDPDSGIGLFYPDRSYFEWFYKIEKTNVDEATASNLKASDIYENLEESMNFLKKHIESKGPYDGLLGFSQGASMVTRLAKIQEETTLVSSKSSFKFVILIGGIPPQEMVNNIDKEALLRIPSLHIMGKADPFLPDSTVLRSLYADSPSKVVMTHEEGHNIPSVRTMLYPGIQNFLDQVKVL